MTVGSNLPVYGPDNETDLLHETQLLLLNPNDQRPGQFSSMKIVAYVSGKKSLFMVSFKICCIHTF